ncbi:hydroxyethylthiazole kinase [Microbacterium sp. YY-01]|uniref:hydroxyethylthiazole kinase n=1 Tax=Microbacterium sp. YY-01 TaxID=3421634 RepID=UPI003D1795B8
MSATAIPIAHRSATLLNALRDTEPLVHCITNNVVTNFTANALLALGAAPAMVDVIGEAGPFTRVAGALLINLGTPQHEPREAQREAIAAAGDAGTPWVLDPVAIGALPVRTDLAHEVVAQHPAAVRGNPSEIMALAGVGSGGKGVDSTDTTDSALHAAVTLARTHKTIVAVSGAEDAITDGQRIIRVANGSALLTKVTGGGCALGALVAAFLAARGEESPLTAVTAAHIVYGVAAERAAQAARHPGSFAVHLLDQLSAITADDIDADARTRFSAAETALSS